MDQENIVGLKGSMKGLYVVSSFEFKVKLVSKVIYFFLVKFSCVFIVRKQNLIKVNFRYKEWRDQVYQLREVRLGCRK